MTNPLPPGAPPSRGGMPKWLIILLVILLIVILGCCGGITMCLFAVRKGAQAIKDNAPAIQQRLQQAAEEAQQRAAAEAQKANGGNTAAPAPGENPMPNAPATPGAAPTATPGATADLPATKLPDAFPTDIPVYSGLTPNYSTTDKVKGSGAVVFTGPGDPDKVAAYYQKEMESNGWKLDTNQTFNNSTILKYSKDWGSATISIVPTDNKVMVNIGYEKK